MKLPSRPLVTAGLLALVLTGCGSSPLRAAAAATVGGVRISSAQLAQTVSAGLADPQAQQTLGADPAKFQRDLLARLIAHVVLAEGAHRAKVVITESQVDTQLGAFAVQAGGADPATQLANLRKAAAQGGVAPADLRGYVHDIVLHDAVADALTADLTVSPATLRTLYQQGIAGFDQVHVRHILVATADLAQTLLTRVRAQPDRFAALAAQYSTDTASSTKGGDLGLAGRGAFVPAFDKAVFAAAPGAFFVVATSFGFHVVQVLGRTTTTLAQATTTLRRQALAAQRTARIAVFLRQVANSMGVQVNPRFGRWDTASGGVTAVAVTASSVASPQARPADASPPPPAP